MTLVSSLAALVLMAAFVVSGLVLMATRTVVPALAVFLDLMMAAGLLRLGTADTWGAIGTAAAVVMVRKVAVAGLHHASASSRLAARVLGIGRQPPGYTRPEP